MIDILWFVKSVVLSGLNQRNLLTLPLNFAVNFSPIFLWLFVFHHAQWIPTDIRPAIHSRCAFYLDQLLFGDFWYEFLEQLDDIDLVNISFVTTALFALSLMVIPALVWFYLYKVKRISYNIYEWYDSLTPKMYKNRYIMPFALPILSYCALNVAHHFAVQEEENFTKTKDMIAWFFYVIMHLTAPILTAVYLYVFHAPGVVKCFGFALGLQNMAGVCTHLLLPMASPWFTHMYGIDDKEHVNYQQEGYAAGLTRVDTHLGTHLNTNGFHLSPIVFGAVPSLHSAIAFQCFLFLCFRATTLKHTFAKRTGLRGNRGGEQHSAPYDISEEDRLSQSGSPLNLASENEGDEESYVSKNEEQSPFATKNSSSTLSGTEEYPLQDLENMGATEQEQQLRFGDSKPSVFVETYVEDTTLTSKWYLKPITTGILPPLLASIFICVQWWTTMYLDHHWRFDLFIGEIYALVSYTIINYFLLQPRVLKEWYDLRRGLKFDSRNEARTMGMRVFQGTRWEWFFDPLA